jgi:hypothetical protein
MLLNARTDTRVISTSYLWFLFRLFVVSKRQRARCRTLSAATGSSRYLRLCQALRIPWTIYRLAETDTIRKAIWFILYIFL